jgi:hypothetical protein
MAAFLASDRSAYTPERSSRSTAAAGVGGVRCNGAIRDAGAVFCRLAA